MKVISVIDFWEHLENPLEQQVKKDIIDFLENNNDSYIINGCYDENECDCDPLLKNYLTKNKDRHLEIDIHDYHWSSKLEWSSYTVCGFHSLHCILYRPVGLFHLMRNYPDRHHDMTLRFDLSCNDDGKHEYIIWPHSQIKKFLKFPNSPINIVTKSR